MERKKGSHLLNIPQSDYVVFDLETTGTNIYSCRIIEIAAVKVQGGVVVDQFCTLVNPQCHIPEEVSEITHITDDMVLDAPVIYDVLPEFRAFIGNEVLIGHSINCFDLNILYDLIFINFKKTLCNNFVDTYTLARHCLDLQNHRLQTIAGHFGVEVTAAHRALDDCMTTYRCYEAMKNLPQIHTHRRISNQRHYKTSGRTAALAELDALLLQIISDTQISDTELNTLSLWMIQHSELAGNYPFDRVFAVLSKALEDGFADEKEKREMLVSFRALTDPVSRSDQPTISDMTGKCVCLTGEFDCGSKQFVQEKLEALGAHCKPSVLKSTDIVIVGGKGSEQWANGNYGTKIKKALELQEKGASIVIVQEKDLKGILV